VFTRFDTDGKAHLDRGERELKFGLCRAQGLAHNPGMRLQQLFNRGLAVVAFALLLAPLAVAQKYRITHADYGAGDARVDVTQRLRELARDNATFRMGNSTFGVDPAPGEVKTLRVFTRGPNDRERVFEFREGSTIDGAMFSGWGRGDWGEPTGQFVIVRALYGAAGQNVDVTQRLREVARENTFFRMGNSTFGVDPAPGLVKTLRIFARGPDGRVQMFEYRESSVVDGAKFSGWGRADWGDDQWKGGWEGEAAPPPGPAGRPDDDRGRLNVIKAVYGAGDQAQDVTGRVQAMVRGGRLDIEVNNDTMGIDPAHDVKKTLWLTYSVGRRSQPQTVEVPEGRQIHLP